MKWTAKQLKAKFEKLKGERMTWESHWQEIGDYIFPRKSDITTVRAQGDKRNLVLVNSTGVQSNTMLASALAGMLTNPTTMWFEFLTGIEELDNNDKIRRWLQKTTRTVHSILNNSNFQEEIHEVYLDLCSFGTTAHSIEEDDEYHVRFKTYHIKDLYLEENHLGQVATILRPFKMNAFNLISMFGKENMHEDVMKCYEKGEDKMWEVIHGIYPMLDESARGFTYWSQYLLVEKDHFIKEGGFRDLPVVISRWAKASGETYGRSPGMDALPDVKMLNAIDETLIKASQKVVDPPLQAPDDGFIAPIRTVPGSLNYYRGGSSDRIEPFGNDANIPVGIEYQREIAQRVRQIYFIDQLQLIQGPQKTATEVLQRTEESVRLLSPMMSRQEHENLRPTLDRVFAILLKRNVINKDEIPEELAGMDLKVKYSSLIAKAQRMSETESIIRAFQLAAPFMQIDPNAADNLNADEALRVISRIQGLPQEMIRDREDRDNMRKARAEQQQQMQQQEQMVAAVDSASQAKKSGLI